MHAEGNRSQKPFIAINCAAIPESLLESELFRYVKGAFSGASNSGKIGKFELANEGKYREDLYYRLNVIPINLPPLRERKEDINEIMESFINKYSIELGILDVKIEEKVMKMLNNYNWPGNIR